MDHEQNVCALRFLRSADIKYSKNGRRNLSTYKMVMNFMITIAKKQNIYKDNPNENEVNKMYTKVCGSVLSLNKNYRCESFSWHSHSRYISKKKERNEIKPSL